MTHIMEFDDHEQMMAYLAIARQAALDNLHPMQAALTYGDHWVQFFDVADRLVIFGRIHTLDETLTGEQDCGSTREEAEEAVERTRIDLEQGGTMFGRAHSIVEPEGELGYTHKGSAWPIPQVLFDAAQQVSFAVDRLETIDKHLLELLYQIEQKHRAAKGI